MAKYSQSKPMNNLNNVEYVLLAEFDIDKGSTVRHQYPKTCPISENILADLMLPEGAHLRETDWNISFYENQKDKINKIMLNHVV